MWCFVEQFIVQGAIIWFLWGTWKIFRKKSRTKLPRKNSGRDYSRLHFLLYTIRKTGSCNGKTSRPENIFQKPHINQMVAPLVGWTSNLMFTVKWLLMPCHHLPWMGQTLSFDSKKPLRSCKHTPQIKVWMLSSVSESKMQCDDMHRLFFLLNTAVFVNVPKYDWNIMIMLHLCLSIKYR